VDKESNYIVGDMVIANSHEDAVEIVIDTLYNHNIPNDDNAIVITDTFNNNQNSKQLFATTSIEVMNPTILQASFLFPVL
jgi:hypothetical protein